MIKPMEYEPTPMEEVLDRIREHVMRDGRGRFTSDRNAVVGDEKWRQTYSSTLQTCKTAQREREIDAAVREGLARTFGNRFWSVSFSPRYWKDLPTINLIPEARAFILEAWRETHHDPSPL